MGKLSKEVTIWLVIGIYAVLMLGIGVWYSRKGADMAGFTVGGRNAGAWISALSYGTAYFSAVMFIGYSGGSGWNYGLWSVLVGLGNALFGTLLAWLVLANRTRALTRRHDIKSMPQMFERRFHSAGMRLFACIVIFVFLIPYSASVYKGLTSVCSVILGIDEQVCMIIIAIASALVLVLGGYMATLKADFVQGLIMMIGVAALIVLVVQSQQVGGFTEGLSRMAKYMSAHEMAPLSGGAATALVSTILMTSFGTWGLPQMIHKYYGIRDKKEVRRGVIISTFFSLLVAGGGYFIGTFSHLFFGETLPEGGTDYVVPLMLDSAGLPNLLIGVILVLLISASVSTLSSIALTACSTVSMDFVKTNIAKKIEDKNLAALTRIFCLVFVVLSFLIANYPTPILEMMSYSWGIISGSFLAPYVLILYWKGLNKAGAWAGMIGGFLTAFLPAALSGFTTPNGPLYACLAMAVSFVLCFAVSHGARLLGWASGQSDERFYAAKSEEIK